MTALADYQRIVIKGTGPGSEIWQTAFSTVSTAAITSQAGLQAYLNTIVPFITTWWSAVRNSIYTSYAWTDVVAYQYQAGNTSAQFQAEAIQAPTPGTDSTAGAPIDTALVCSLRTAVPGRRTRGRMYVPCHVAVPAATGQWASTVANTYAQALKTLFDSVISGSTGAPAVVSRTGNTFELVTAVVCDSKPDVQRRRENRMTPASTIVAVV